MQTVDLMMYECKQSRLFKIYFVNLLKEFSYEGPYLETNLGYGLFFTAFCPYFLHLYPSSRWSTSLLVINANRGSFCFFSPFFFALLLLHTNHNHLHQLSLMSHKKTKDAVGTNSNWKKNSNLHFLRVISSIFRPILLLIFLALFWILFCTSLSWRIRDRRVWGGNLIFMTNTTT